MDWWPTVHRFIGTDYINATVSSEINSWFSFDELFWLFQVRITTVSFKWRNVRFHRIRHSGTRWERRTLERIGGIHMLVCSVLTVHLVRYWYENRKRICRRTYETHTILIPLTIWWWCKIGIIRLAFLVSVRFIIRLEIINQKIFSSMDVDDILSPNSMKKNKILRRRRRQQQQQQQLLSTTLNQYQIERIV